jgi:hypothetical protein
MSFHREVVSIFKCDVLSFFQLDILSNSGTFQSNRPQNCNLHFFPLTLLFAAVSIGHCALLSLLRSTICTQFVHFPHLFHVARVSQFLALLSDLDTCAFNYTAKVLTHTLICDGGVNDPVFAFVGKLQGQLHGDQVRGGIAQAELLVRFANVVVGREAEYQL